MTGVGTAGTSTVADQSPEEVGCHVYAVVRADQPVDLEQLQGLDGAPLRLVPHGAVAAVVNDIRLERPPGRKAELVAYRDVLDALAAAGPVVPVEFGSVLPDDVSVVEELLAPEEELFADLLDQLDGRIQLNLYAAYREGVALREVVAAEPEIARLREHTRQLPEDAAYADRVRLGELVARAMEAKVEDDAAALVEACADHVAAYDVTLRSGVDDLAKVSLLVDRDRQEEVEEHLEALAEAVHERLALRLVGPMAPYDFVRRA